MSSQTSSLSYTTEEFKCYKVCSVLVNWHGSKYVSAVVGESRWGVEYRLGQFSRRPNIYGAGGLLAFEHLVPAAMFAKTMYPIGLLFLATGRGRIPLYSSDNLSAYQRRAVRLGHVDTEKIMVEGWPHGTVCYDEIRLDERIPLEMGFG